MGGVRGLLISPHVFGAFWVSAWGYPIRDNPSPFPEMRHFSLERKCNSLNTLISCSSSRNRRCFMTICLYKSLLPVHILLSVSLYYCMPHVCPCLLSYFMHVSLFSFYWLYLMFLCPGPWGLSLKKKKKK